MSLTYWLILFTTKTFRLLRLRPRQSPANVVVVAVLGSSLVWFYSNCWHVVLQILLCWVSCVFLWYCTCMFCLQCICATLLYKGGLVITRWFVLLFIACFCCGSCFTFFLCVMLNPCVPLVGHIAVYSLDRARVFVLFTASFLPFNNQVKQGITHFWHFFSSGCYFTNYERIYRTFMFRYVQYWALIQHFFVPLVSCDLLFQEKKLTWYRQLDSIQHKLREMCSIKSSWTLWRRSFRLNTHTYKSCSSRLSFVIHTRLWANSSCCSEKSFIYGL
jgi:hypothetical protein